MKLINYIWEMDIYDPRKGQEFNLYTMFSSRKNNFLVIHVYGIWKYFDKTPSLDIEQLESIFRRLMFAALPKTGAIGFFCCSWLTHKTRKIDFSIFSDVVKAGNSILGYFDVNDANIKKMEMLRTELQTYEEWIIGSCSEKFNKPQNIPIKWHKKIPVWDFGTLVNQPQNIGSLFMMDRDSGIYLILMRTWDGIDELIEPIYKVILNPSKGNKDIMERK